MTSRERVLTTIAHSEPDRVPFNVRPDPLHRERLREIAGDVDFAEHFRHDIRFVSIPLPSPPEGVDPKDWTPSPAPSDIADAAEAAWSLQARGVGAQSILSGTADEVCAGVLETLRIMAPGGGYIAAPCHTLTPEVPFDNVVALHDALQRFGHRRYRRRER